MPEPIAISDLRIASLNDRVDDGPGFPSPIVARSREGRKWQLVQRVCTKGQGRRRHSRAAPVGARGRRIRKRRRRVGYWPLRGRIAQFPRQPAKLGRRIDTQFFHQLGAIRLDRAQSDAEFIGDLLVELARNDAIEDFALSGC